MAGAPCDVGENGGSFSTYQENAFQRHSAKVHKSINIVLKKEDADTVVRPMSKKTKRETDCGEEISEEIEGLPELVEGRYRCRATVTSTKYKSQPCPYWF